MDEKNEIHALKIKYAALEQRVQEQEKMLEMLIDFSRRSSASFEKVTKKLEENLADGVLKMKQAIIDDIKASLHL